MVLAQEWKWHLLLGLEDTLMTIRQGYEYSTFSGDSCVQKLFTLWAKYQVQPVFCDGRRELARYIEETFLAYERVSLERGSA